MTLLDDFFSLPHCEQTGNTVHARMALNKNHAVYAGHFPGNPVFPGALMVQSVVEILSLTLGKPLALYSADSIKFLSVIDPQAQPEVEVEIKFNFTDNGIQTEARLFAGPVIFFKLKAVLKPA